MKKFLFLATSAMLVTALSGCATTGKQLYILQNKPEIDTQLKAFANIFAGEFDVDVKVVSCGGGSCDLATVLQSDIAAGEIPDIFTIDGISAYNQYKDLILDVTGEEWTNDTDLAFKVDSRVYGFPVAVEGWGMAYNADLLAKANINPKTLNNYANYKAAFEKLDGMKAELGIDSVVSMAASADMSWVTRDHNFNSYVSAGLGYTDTSVLDAVLGGNVDTNRMSQYANWVELLFKFANPTVLLSGGYDEQVGAFAQQKAVFLHQGNWVEPNLKTANANFKRGFAPHGTLTATTDAIFVAAPTFYVIHKNSKNIQAAKDYLNFLASSPAGHNYMVNEIGAIPAFKSIDIAPTAPLSVSVLEWVSEGKLYSWNFTKTNADFRKDSLGPVYTAFADATVKGQATAKANFISGMTTALQTLKP
jgi:raffinose/stachyose/melibiose transport system substrate-binding protein